MPGIWDITLQIHVFGLSEVLHPIPTAVILRLLHRTHKLAVTAITILSSSKCQNVKTEIKFYDSSVYSYNIKCVTLIQYP